MEPVGGGCSSLVPAAACPNQGQGQQNQLLAGKQPPALPLRVWAQVPGRSEILLQDDLNAVLHRDGPAPGSVRMQFLSPRLRRIAALPAVEGANAAAGVSTASAINVIVVSTAFMIPRERKVRAYNSDVCVPLLGAGCALTFKIAELLCQRGVHKSFEI